jgi:hypothetical protein
MPIKLSPALMGNAKPVASHPEYEDHLGLPVNKPTEPPKKILTFDLEGNPTIDGQVLGAPPKNPEPSVEAITGNANPDKVIAAAKTVLAALKSIDENTYKSLVLEHAQTILPASQLVSGKAPALKKGTLGTPIPLKDATMLNQPVKGSSGGSVYRVVGIGDRIRVATRRKGVNLSVRVEGNITHSERAALIEMGFGDSGSYLSSHFKCNDCPPERVLGALFYNPGLEFKYKVTSFNEVDDGI